MWKPDICIHHFPCDDGFAAAWVVRRKWGDGVVFKGTNYGQPLDIDLTGKKVLIVDFSFKPDVLADLAASADSIIILDHHKTAEADLAEIDSFGGDVEHAGGVLEGVRANTGRNVIAWFDMEKSGAMLAWEFCFPGIEPPKLIHYIQDRDLWRMQIPHGRAVSLLLRSWPFDFDDWSRIAELLEHEPERVLAEAAAIERFYDRKLDELIPAAVRHQDIGGHSVPVLNVPWSFASDAAHALLKAHPDAAFAAAYFDNGGGRTYSLRSENSRADVSEIARQYGGGGHRNAAGFRMPL